MRKYLRIITIFLGILVVVVELINIFLSNSLATASIQANKLQDQLHLYEQKNLVLKEKLLGFTSFEIISSRAAELGFVEPKKIISLDTSSEIALKR